jgi:thiol-disulfide isomerase/thioredoxin
MMSVTRLLVLTLLTAAPLASADVSSAAQAEPEPIEAFLRAFKNRADPQVRFHVAASQLDQALERAGQPADDLARALLRKKGEVVSDGEVGKLLDSVAQRKPALAARFLVQIARARFVAQGSKGSAHVAVGQLEVADGKVDPTMVMAQTPILEEGWFATEVGDLKRSLSFRSHGYQDLVVRLRDTEADVLCVGRVTLKPLPVDERASLKGRVVLDGAADASPAVVHLTVDIGPIVNTPSGGYSPRRSWPEGLSVPVSKDGQFVVEGLNPSDYYLRVSADGHVEFGRRVRLAPGGTLDVGTYRLLSSDLGFYLGKAAPKTEELAWEKDYASALKRAAAEKKPLLVMMTATWCGPCKLLEEKTLNDPWVRHFLSSFVVVKAYEDKEVERTYGLSGYPTLVFTDSSGKLAHKCVGYMPVINFSTECAKAFKALSVEPPSEMRKLIEKGMIKTE